MIRASIVQLKAAEGGGGRGGRQGGSVSRGRSSKRAQAPWGVTTKGIYPPLPGCDGKSTKKKKWVKVVTDEAVQKKKKLRGLSGGRTKKKKVSLKTGDTGWRPAIPPPPYGCSFTPIKREKVFT